MNLADYLATSDMTAAELARKTGLSAASITRIAKGDQSPSADAMRKIVTATRGAVSAHDLIFSVAA